MMPNSVHSLFLNYFKFRSFCDHSMLDLYCVLENQGLDMMQLTRKQTIKINAKYSLEAFDNTS